MKKEVPRRDFLTEKEQLIFNLTKQQALTRLKRAKVSSSEQMLTKWCREGEISALRIAKGAPENRGLRISSRSLDAFIRSRKGNVEELLKRIEMLEETIKQKDEKIEGLENIINSIRETASTPKKTRNKFMKFEMDPDTLLVKFKYGAYYYKVLFDNDEVIQVIRDKNASPVTDVTDQMDEEFIAAVTQKRVEAMKKANA